MKKKTLRNLKAIVVTKAALFMIPLFTDAVHEPRNKTNITITKLAFTNFIIIGNLNTNCELTWINLLSSGNSAFVKCWRKRNTQAAIHRKLSTEKSKSRISFNV